MPFKGIFFGFMMASQEEKKWSRPVAKEGSSAVWKYFELELPEKGRVKCNMCPSKIFKFSGSTYIMWYHLERVHQIHKSSRSKAFIDNMKSTAKQSQIQSATANSANSNASTSGENVSPSPSQTAPPAMTQLSIAGSFARGKLLRESRDKIYARMAAKDRISFFTMANSFDIQQRLIAAGHKPYLSHADVAREISKVSTVQKIIQK